MNDSELKDILLSIQGNIIGLNNKIDETRNSLHNEIIETKNSLHSEIEGLHGEIEEVKSTVKKLELTLENETNKKISALFDSRIDEMRHRKENARTIMRVDNLEMRVDNLEKALKTS